MTILQQTKTNGQYTVTLPKALVNGLGWNKGQVLRFNVVGRDRLELTVKQKE